jgi:restriction system protein
MGGIQTCIQVKRQKTVGRPVVQNLRGSLGAHETGVLVTSGEFTADAGEEAEDASKAPIILIGGSKLIDLLVEHQIGVHHRNIQLYTLALDDLSEEQLETRVEETDESES